VKKTIFIALRQWRNNYQENISALFFIDEITNYYKLLHVSVEAGIQTPIMIFGLTILIFLSVSQIADMIIQSLTKIKLKLVFDISIIRQISHSISWANLDFIFVRIILS
jgi:hypothetical protein